MSGASAGRAVLWTTIDGIGTRVVQLVTGIILARLLSPEEFGLIAMVTIFVEVARVMSTGGFGDALVQRQHATAADADTVFFINLILSAAVGALFLIFSGAVAGFFGKPILSTMLQWLSVIVFVNAFSVVQLALLTKAMDFRAIALAGTGGVLVGSAIGVWMAMGGYGVWSLVFQQISGAIVSTAIFWIFSKWRPTLRFDRSSAKSMFSFGSRMAIATLLDRLFHNAYYLFIGRLFGALDLGFFFRARTLQDAPAQTVGSVVSRIMFPMLAAIQTDVPRMRDATRTATELSAFVMFPLMIGLAAVADTLIPVLLTDKWTPSVVYFQILCLASAWLPFHVINLAVLTATGQSKLFLRLEIWKIALVVIGLIAGWPWGVLGITVGILVTSVLALVLNALYTKKLIHYGLWSQLRDMSPYMLASLLMAVAILLVGRLDVPGSGWLLLLLQAAAALVVYLVACKLMNLRALAVSLEALQSKFR